MAGTTQPPPPGTLAQYEQLPSANHGGPFAEPPTLLVMHYTAGDWGPSVAWLRNPASRASAHFIVGEDGHTAQLVDIDRVAWHAGRSSWGGRAGVNAFALGIELVNPGPLAHVGGHYLAWRRWDPADVLVAPHHSEPGHVRCWARYPTAQVLAAEALARDLRHAYPSITEVLGHDDVAPGRKLDPGPAFPWPEFRNATVGGGAGGAGSCCS